MINHKDTEKDCDKDGGEAVDSYEEVYTTCKY